MGVGFTLGLLLISFIREVFGNGTITLFPIEAIGFEGTIFVPGLSSLPARVIGLASGALLVMGLLQGFFNWIGPKIEEYKQLKENKNHEESQKIESSNVSEAGDKV
jgi:electron transport complex protein RnfE